MKKVIITSLLVMMVLGIGAAFAYQSDTGRGGPSGPHFNLNLIGIKDDHEKNMEDCDSGHRIFIKLGSKKNGSTTTTTRIYLTESPDDSFAVLDCDGTDGTAEFMLPNPAPVDPELCPDDKPNQTRYSVWARPLGSNKNNPWVRITTCGEPCIEWDPATGECTDVGEEVCSTESVTLTRTKGGKQRFENVSKELLTLCVEVLVGFDAEGNPIYELQRRYLFDPLFENYLWKVDNTGVRLVQLRFYMEPSCYSDEEWSCPNRVQ